MPKKLSKPVMIDVIHIPAHYNKNCGCMIPDVYEAFVVSGVPEIDDPENADYEERFGYRKCRIYAMGSSLAEAISLLGHELRTSWAYSGRMRRV